MSGMRFLSLLTATALALPLLLSAPQAVSEDAEVPTTSREDYLKSLNREARVEALLDDLQQSEAADSAKELVERIIREWSQSDSATIDLLLKRGKDALAKGDTDQALDFLTRVVAFAPRFSEGWNARATLHFTTGDFGLSLADIRRTLALQPRHFGALSGLGLVLEKLEDKENALAAYQAALQIHPYMEGPKKGIERLTDEVDGQPI